MYNYENQDYLQHLTEKSELWYQDVLAALLSVQPKEVLELGCGDGGFSRLMAEQKIRVLALDHSKTFLEYARRRTKSRLVQFEQANLDSAVGLHIAGRRFQAVVSVDVIEHLRRKERLLKDVAGVLEEDGYLVLQVPNLYCNMISQNYVHSPINLLRKFRRGVRGAWRQFRHKPPEDICRVEYGLDYRVADHDAVWLSSPFWYLDFFRRHNWELVSFTSFSFDTNKVWLKRILRLAGHLPLLRWLGGRMIIIARYRGKQPRPRKKRAEH
ncbi:MAG TPA: class I SAM-dependent methyltransferase [Spirochaetota bacterium]|nr:class I SAM-dependent methyltransferase [Spirochaetota bacterium]